MHPFESSEDYLERILMLQEKLGSVRSIDIANDMNFSKPSVSIAMKKLKDNSYIDIDDKGKIILTEKGLEIATKTYEKHRLITTFLESIGVSSYQAQKDACLIEHDLSDESFDAIKRYVLSKQ
ncbi:MAG: metal-dependent transcriptional regulator [Bacilli bacterium]|nr:metal-dependent transcriptional regulator [Bacilli bacterium]MDY5745590.1 metal-dependent transcriptional regulator [Bacilli bacterium]